MVKLKFTTMLIALLLFLSACQQPPTPITMVNMNAFNGFKLHVVKSPEDMPLSDQVITIDRTNAPMTLAYELIKEAIYLLENDTYERLKNDKPLTAYTRTDTSSLILDIKGLVSNENQAMNYQIFIDPLAKSGVITSLKHSINLTSKQVDGILQSNLLPVSMDGLDYVPQLAFVYDNQSLDYSGYTTFYHQVYENRYVKANRTFSSSKTYHIRHPQAGISLKSADNFYPSTLTYTFSKDGKVLSTGKLDNDDTGLIPLPKEAGNFRLSINTTWENTTSTSSYQGHGDGSYILDLAIEPIESFSLNQAQYEPGDLVILEGFNMDEDLNYTIDTNIYNEGVSFHHTDTGTYLMLPLMSKTKPDTYYLSVYDHDHPDKVFSFDIVVVDKVFETQYLTTSSTTASLRNDEAYAQLDQAFARGRSGLSEEKLWDGPFIQPVTGRVSTEYGEIRYTNDDVISSRHSGIDWAVPGGTVIVAAANGYITLAEKLTITGNTVFIDHGQGLVSQNYHMKTIYVQLGDYVKAGDPIGEVGTTGYSTGNHLHYAIYYSGVYINPWKLFQKEPY